ncbi:MAG: HD-GYP domain-containing protein [Solirubrobacterales bacterium]|nr:HD-GYP domain-containing protein [Solirubrobacterales bacterium]
MALKPSFEEQELLAETLRRAGSRMPKRERRLETGFAMAFVAAAAGVWWLAPPHTFSPLPAVMCLLVLVLAMRVRFATPLGFTVATQLAFVPLLFAIPVAIVPLATVGALMLAALPEVIRRRTRPSRVLLAVANSWFALGPAMVFAASGTQPRLAGAGLLTIALVAQFLTDFAVSALRFRLDRDVGLSAQLRETWVYGIDAGLSAMALVVAEDIHKTAIVALAPLPLLALLATFARERRARIESLLELNVAYRGTALVLGDVVEADDGYTGEHCKSVVRLALSLGDALGLDAERRRNLEFGALLHDVGKIAIPKEIINKPGKLDPEEWRIIETHTVEGQKMLDRIGGFMRSVGLIVRSHHERWDGGGYPDGLVADAIPLEARIIACCDSWNAMRTDRSYRKALSYDVARAELLANAGGQFDPGIVATFLSVVTDERADRAAAPARRDLDAIGELAPAIGG